jgi:hypothetical protein
VLLVDGPKFSLVQFLSVSLPGSVFFSLPCDLSFSGFYSQSTIRFFQPLIAGVMAAMAAAGVR